MRDSQGLYDSLVTAFDPEAVVRDLCDMISIRSENPFDGPVREGYREREMADFYRARLAGLGFEVDSRDVVPGRPNAWGRLKGGGGGPTLMLAGHLDTVGTEGYEAPFDPKVEHGRVYGRGSCDMKAALAAYLEVARLVVQGNVKLRGDLIIAGIADEEWGLTGSQDVGRNGPTADFGIIGEPSNLTICPTHKGQYAVAIRTFGKAVHSSVPEKGHNAIEDMGRVIGAFASHDKTLLARAPDPLCGHGRFSMGVIHGGTMVCTVPDVCELEVDRRTVPGETAETVRKEYTEVLESLVGLKYELSETLTEVAPLEVPLNSEIVQTVVKAYEAVTNRPASIQAHPAATDAPNLPFPAIIFGPGTCEQAHSLCEYVEIEQLETVTKTYLRAVLELLA